MWVVWLAYVACRSVDVRFTEGVPPLLQCVGCPLECLDCQRWRSRGRLPSDGCNSSAGNGSHNRSGTTFERGLLDGDAGRTTGVSLSTGEKEMACGKWARLSPLGGSRSMGSTGIRTSPKHYVLDTFDGHSFFRGEEDQFWIRQTRQSSRLHQNPNGKPGWKSRGLHHARAPWPCDLCSVAGILSSLPDSPTDAGSDHHGHFGNLRICHREVFKTLSWSLAFDRGGRQSGTRRTPHEAEGHHHDGSFRRKATSRKMGSSCSMGVYVQETHPGSQLLGRANPCTGERLVKPWVKGQAPHTCGIRSKRVDERWKGSHQSRNRRSCRDGDITTGTKDQESIQARQQEKEDPARSRGIAKASQRSWEREELKRQRQTSALFRLEQQQWGLCWTPSRCRLPRKSRKRTQVYQVQLAGPPISCMQRWNPSLLVLLKVDWARDASSRRPPRCSTASWIWVAAGSSEKKRKSEDQQGKTSEQAESKRKRFRKPVRPEDQGDEGEEKVTYHGHQLTLEEYIKTRQFRFLHYYAGSGTRWEKPSWRRQS